MSSRSETERASDLGVAIRLAETLRRRREYDEACRVLVAALLSSFAREDPRELEDQLRASHLLAGISVVAGRTAAAEELFAAVGKTRRELGEHEHADFIDLQRVHLALSDGRTGQAREMLRDIDDIGVLADLPDTEEDVHEWEQGRSWRTVIRPLLLVQAYGELSRALLASGVYVAATTFAGRGIALALGPKAHTLVAEQVTELRLDAAETAICRGHIAAARALLAAIGDVDATVHPGWEARRLALESRVAFSRGDPGTALGRCQALLEHARTLGMGQGIASAHANLAELHLLLNQSAVATRHVAEAFAASTALPIVERLRPIVDQIEARRPLYFDAPEPLSVARYDQAAPRRAEAPARPGPRASTALATHFDGFIAASVRLRVALDPATADKSLKAFQIRYANSSSDFVRLRVRLLTGLTDYVCGRYSCAEQHLVAAAAEARVLGAVPDLYDAQRWLAWSWKRLGRTGPELASLQRENWRMIEEMAATLTIDNRAAFLLDKWTEEEDELGEEINAIRGAGWWRRTERLHRLLDRMFVLKESLERKWTGGISEEQLTKTPLWRRLLMSPAKATVIFLVLPTNTVVFRLSLGSIVHRVIDIRREDVRKLVADWHVAATERTVAARNLTHALHLDEVFDGIPFWTRHVTIIPDDALHGFPWAVLPIAGGMLIDRFSFSIAAHLRETRPAGRTEPTPKFALIGMSRGLPHQAVLKCASNQLEAVERCIDRSKAEVMPWKVDTTTPELACRAVEEASFVHITCHGELVPDDPDRSGLVLSDGVDGIRLLSLREIMALDARRLRHATLVSCWSADAYVRPGRWVVSLPEILVRAGARCVVASLWEVSENEAIQFVEMLYERMAHEPRARALQRAQRQARDSDDFVNEQVWAAFQVYGDAGRLRLGGFGAR